MPEELTIRDAEWQRDLEVVRELFGEYASALGFGLDFQDFDRELEELPGEYRAPRGALILATRGKETLGCVAMRPLGRELCEMKRLYVRLPYRGRGIGRRLAERVVARARAAGYRSMRLDTIDTMTEAMTLYRSLGFVEREAYRYNPIAGAVYFELDLGRSGDAAGGSQGGA